MSIELRGIAWDHPRSTAPLADSLPRFAALHPDVHITWDSRSLFSFGEGSIESLASQYDLVLYDHPFVGQVAEEGLMIDLAKQLSASTIKQLRADSLGPSFQSYEWGGGTLCAASGRGGAGSGMAA